jgi:hypothetical protein
MEGTGLSALTTIALALIGAIPATILAWATLQRSKVIVRQNTALAVQADVHAAASSSATTSINHKADAITKIANGNLAALQAQLVIANHSLAEQTAQLAHLHLFVEELQAELRRRDRP